VDAFHIDRLTAGLDPSQHDFDEFFFGQELSLTLARWLAGEVDTQTPHTEDEVYYVVSGRARITVAGETEDVTAGSIVFVAAGVEHRFHDIEEDLLTLVFWAPPRHSREQRGQEAADGPAR
jgi:mannose-6-phosphate isomerase-like protein (cupin superfamily)